MSSRPLSPPPPAAETKDPEAEGTGELLVLDPAVYESEDEPRGVSDTWVMPVAESEALAASAAHAERTGQLEGELQSLAASLREAQQLLARRDERLVELEKARDDAQLAHTSAEQQLGQAREAVTAALERVAELERTLEERESASHQEREKHLEAQQELAAQNRVHAERLMGELAAEQARAVSYFESLKSAEGRRQIFESVVTDLERDAEERATDLVRLAREIGGRDSRARELEDELVQRARRIAELEEEGRTLGVSVSERNTQLREAREETQGLHAKVGRLMSELAAGGERVRALEARGEQQDTSDSQQQAEIKRLNIENAELAAEIALARATMETATSRVAEHESALTQGRGNAAGLETELAAERRRVADLERELETLRGEMEDWAGALKILQQERNSHVDTLSSAQSRVHELEKRAAEQLDTVRVLQAESNAGVARARELEDDLRAAEDAVNRLEAEARNRTMRIEELERTAQEWRAVYDEVRQRATDPHAHPALRDAARQMLGGETVEIEGAGLAPAPDGATRLLVQVGEGGREIVHVLGRRTSIGRTPDNDLQIDAKFVSRHHCVILAGPAQTIIEDLNSTNGVMVNGKRIARQPLKDGDQVVIGRALYRFVVRKETDKR